MVAGMRVPLGGVCPAKVETLARTTWSREITGGSGSFRYWQLE
jgi:hypothetical protein